MYTSLPKGKTNILLWCDGRPHHNCDTSEELGKSQKHKSSVDTNPPPPDHLSSYNHTLQTHTVVRSCQVVWVACE